MKTYFYNIMLCYYTFFIINLLFILSCSKNNRNEIKTIKSNNIEITSGFINNSEIVNENQEKGEIVHVNLEVDECFDLIDFKYEFKPIYKETKKNNYEKYKIYCDNIKKINIIMNKIRTTIDNCLISDYQFLPIFTNLPKQYQKIINQEIYVKKLKKNKLCCNLSKYNFRKIFGGVFLLMSLFLEGIFVYMMDFETYLYYKGCDKQNDCKKYDLIEECYKENKECKTYIYGQYWYFFTYLYPLFFLLVLFPIIMRIVDPYFLNTKNFVKKAFNILCANNKDLNCFEPPVAENRSNKFYDVVCCREPDIVKLGWGRCFCGICIYPFCYRSKTILYNSSLYKFICCNKKLNEKNEKILKI